MRKTLITVLAVSSFGFAGCQHFVTRQTQLDTQPDGTTRKTETRAAATTFFDSKGSLATFNAKQTDKTQGAQVGGLYQESSGSNAVALVQSAVSAAVNAAVQAAKAP